LTPCGRGNPISSDNSGLASAYEETKEILAIKVKAVAEKAGALQACQRKREKE
jgi:hypothetical protein